MTSKEKLKKMYDYIMIDNEQGLMDKEEVEALTEDYNIIKQDLDRLEELKKENQELKEENSKFKKVIDFLKLNFNISLDSKLRIDDGSECIQTFIVHLPENTTIDEMFEIIPEVLCNDK